METRLELLVGCTSFVILTFLWNRQDVLFVVRIRVMKNNYSFGLSSALSLGCFICSVFKPMQHFNLKLQKRTLHTLSFIVVDCGHIDLGFMVHLKRLSHITWHFRYFDAPFKNKYITSMSGMLFLMFVQSLFQFGTKVGK